MFPDGYSWQTSRHCFATHLLETRYEAPVTEVWLETTTNYSSTADQSADQASALGCLERRLPKGEETFRRFPQRRTGRWPCGWRRRRRSGDLKVRRDVLQRLVFRQKPVASIDESSRRSALDAGCWPSPATSSGGRRLSSSCRAGAAIPWGMARFYFFNRCWWRC
jgi:hypothetical protein